MIPKRAGFTLVDTLITTTVIGLLAAVAMPTLQDYRSATLAGTTRLALGQRLMQASTTAANLGEHVVLCPSAGRACLRTEDWSMGMLAFIDADGNREYEPSERILFDAPPTPPGIGLRSSVGRQRIVFQPNGGNAGSNVTFTLCDPRGPTKAMSLILSNGGNWRQTPSSPKAAEATCRG